jgi:hypothetical protein
MSARAIPRLAKRPMDGRAVGFASGTPVTGATFYHHCLSGPTG